MSDVEKLIKVMEQEAMARCRYEIYAQIAKEEGLDYFAKIFEETSRNELSHVKELMGLLKGTGTTLENLNLALKNEELESTVVYPKLHEEAIIENDLEKARFFKQLAKIEGRHMERFSELKKLLENDSVYKRETPIIWKCRVCGYIYEGLEPPKKCPGCQNSYSCFEPNDFSI